MLLCREVSADLVPKRDDAMLWAQRAEGSCRAGQRRKTTAKTLSRRKERKGFSWRTLRHLGVFAAKNLEKKVPPEKVKAVETKSPKHEFTQPIVTPVAPILEMEYYG
jgi:hypothetical protein